jgi:O-antigen ligase
MLFNGLIVIVLLSPLPFGLNHPWSWSLCSLLVGFLSILWAITVFRKTDSQLSLNPLKSMTDMIVVFIVVLIWAIYQAVVPVSVDKFHPVWTLTKDALQTQITPLIALTPDDAMMAIMRILSYGLVFLLTFYYCQAREKAKVVFLGLMYAGFIYSLYGLVIYFGKYGLVLWRESNASLSTVNSTFINRNHFATFAGLTLLCSLALLTEGINSSAKYNIGGYIGWQRFFENLITRTWLSAVAFMIIGTALVLTGSRGGFFSSLLAIFVLLLALNLNAQTRNYYVLWLIAIFAILGAFIFNLSSSSLLAKLDSQGLTDSLRETVFALSWSAILNNPRLGFGLGSFAEVFPLYKNQDYSGTVTRPLLQDYAHNTYLENMFELGIPASLALFYCFLRLVLICGRGLFVRKRDWIYPAVGLSATCLIAAHALVDFSMQIPAVAYIYVLLMGAACGQSFATKKM